MNKGHDNKSSFSNICQWGGGCEVQGVGHFLQGKGPCTLTFKTYVH